MTREEAIEVIKQDIPCEHDTDLIEALEMAIQALVIIDKIEPMFGDMLDIPTQELMRDATPEERESIDKYIKSISKPTGIEFDEEQEQIDFIQSHKTISCKIKAQADGEYISKEKAIIQLSWDLSEVELPRIKESLDKLLSVAIPSAEPKTGHWIAQDIYNCHTNFKCSECGYIHNFMHLYGKPTADYTYCPNCGAKMSENPTGSESEVDNG